MRLRERRLVGARVDLGEEIADLDELALREADLISLPEIWVFTVTVASGVTVPSASMVIGISPRVGVGGAHGLRRRAAFSAGFLSTFDVCPARCFSQRSKATIASAGQHDGQASAASGRRLRGGRRPRARAGASAGPRA